MYAGGSVFKRFTSTICCIESLKGWDFWRFISFQLQRRIVIQMIRYCAIEHKLKSVFNIDDDGSSD